MSIGLRKRIVDLGQKATFAATNTALKASAPKWCWCWTFPRP